MIGSYTPERIIDFSTNNKSEGMEEKYDYEKEYFKALDQIHEEDRNPQTIIDRTKQIMEKVHTERPLNKHSSTHLLFSSLPLDSALVKTVSWSLKHSSLHTALEIAERIRDEDPYYVTSSGQTIYFDNPKISAFNEIINYCSDNIDFETLNIEEFFKIVKAGVIDDCTVEKFIKKYLTNISESQEYEKFLNCLNKLQGCIQSRKIFNLSRSFGKELIKKNEWEYLIKLSQEIIYEDTQKNKPIASYLEDLSLDSEDSKDSEDSQLSSINSSIIEGLRSCLAQYYLENKNYPELIRICTNNKNIYEVSRYLESYAIKLFKEGEKGKARKLIEQMNNKSKNICLSEIISITLDNINMKKEKFEKSLVIDKCINDYEGITTYPSYELKQEAINRIGEVCLEHELYESFRKYTYHSFHLRKIDSKIQDALFINMMKKNYLDEERAEMAGQYQLVLLGSTNGNRFTSIVTSLLEIGLQKEAKIILRAIDHLTASQEMLNLKKQLLIKIEESLLEEQFLTKREESALKEEILSVGSQYCLEIKISEKPLEMTIHNSPKQKICS